MKHIIILFLFFSSIAFSQNYYSLDKAPVPDTENPSIPLNLLASNVAQTTVDLSWTAATDNVAVTNYRIYNNGTLLVAAGNVTSFILTDLNPDTVYILTIRAVDAANNESNNSNDAVFNTGAITTPDTEAPSAPISLLASNVGETSASLSWTASTDESGIDYYVIYNNGNILIANTGSDNIIYDLTGLLLDTEYIITVRAVDTYGNESTDSNSQIFTTNSINISFTYYHINGEDDSIIETMTNGYSNTENNFQNFNLRAIPSISVGSLQFSLVGPITINRTESGRPYALWGDNSGDYSEGDDLIIGSYTLTVTAWSGNSGKGELVGQNVLNFNVTGDIADTENPTAPNNFLVNNVTSATVDLIWTAATDNVGVIDYKIYNNGAEIVSTTSGNTSYNLTGLTESTAYNLTIRAIDNAVNESVDSNNQVFTTKAPDIENPTTPTNFIVNNVTSATADLIWTAATDNVGVIDYKIYNNGTEIVSTTSGNTSYSLTGLTASTDYNLTIRAIDNANNEGSDSNNQVFTTKETDTENPTAPINLVVSNIGNTTVNLTWTAATDNVAIVNYRIYNEGTVLVNSVGNITSYNLNDLSPATAYNLTVRALDAASNESGDSNTEVFTTSNTNTYTLTENSKVSIGVYAADNTLLRSLTSYEAKTAGTYSAPNWDGLDNDGNDVTAQADHYKVLANALTAEWEGTMANTSNVKTGVEKWHRYTFVKDMVIDGNTAWVAHDYSEGQHAIAGMDLDNYQQKIEYRTTRIVHPAYCRLTYDGTTLYMAGQGVKASDNLSGVSASTIANLGNPTNWLTFQGDVIPIYNGSFKAANVINSNNYGTYDEIVRVTGLAVQTGNDNLFVAREDINRLHVIHKTTGVQRQELTITAPKHSKIDNDGNFWLVHDNGSGNEIIEKYTINNTTGAITTTGFTIDGSFQNIQGVAFSPDGTTVAISDSRTAAPDQVFGYNVNTGALLWTLGRNEGYHTDATVYDDKFMFKEFQDENNHYGFLAYESDGSLWVNDRGNYRYIKFDAARNYVDQVMWMEGGYRTNVHSNDPTRVFYEMLEFEIDYTKPLLADGGANGSWTFIRNWGAIENLANAGGSTYSRLKNPTQLSNGRTYCTMKDKADGRYDRMYEMVVDGALRDTGITYSDIGQATMSNNGRIERNHKSGTTQDIYRRNITGFDGSNNPIISNETKIKSFETKGKVLHQGARGGFANQYTNNGNRVMFDGNQGLGDYHIGSYDMVNNKYKFAIFPGVLYGRNADYPLETGKFDSRDQPQRYGGEALAVDDIIIFNHHGEFWRNTQTNYYHVVSEDGLPIFDFGEDGLNTTFGDSKAKMGGNTFGISAVKVNGDIYLYHNDESWHGGFHRWKISNLNSIQKFRLELN